MCICTVYTVQVSKRRAGGEGRLARCNGRLATGGGRGDGRWAVGDDPFPAPRQSHPGPAASSPEMLLAPNLPGASALALLPYALPTVTPYASAASAHARPLDHPSTTAQHPYSRCSPRLLAAPLAGPPCCPSCSGQPASRPSLPPHLLPWPPHPSSPLCPRGHPSSICKPQVAFACARPPPLPSRCASPVHSLGLRSSGCCRQRLDPAPAGTAAGTAAAAGLCQTKPPPRAALYRLHVRASAPCFSLLVAGAGG